MKINYSLFLIFFLVFTSCGYTPIFKNTENIDFKINILEISGERKINNLIKSNLNNYILSNSKNIFNIKINSKYSKNILAKDSTGAATEYKIVLEGTFKITNDKFEDKYKFKESFNMQSINDKLDEQDYEKNIQTNLANIITRKLILKLSTIK